jgi:hypothetical protein
MSASGSGGLHPIAELSGAARLGCAGTGPSQVAVLLTNVSEHGNDIRPDLEHTASDCEGLLLTLEPHPQDAVIEGCQQRRMVWQDAHFTFRSWSNDDVCRSLKEHLILGDDLALNWHQVSSAGCMLNTFLLSQPLLQSDQPS